MKSFFKILVISVIAIVCLLVLVACGGHSC